jgi:hypothetical protein
MTELRIKTELGELPASWHVQPLGEFLSEAQYGTSVKGNAAGSCPILRMTNQVNGRISPTNLQYANLSSRELEKFRVKCGDILFNRTNSFELVGRTAIFDLDGDYAFASDPPQNCRCCPRSVLSQRLSERSGNATATQIHCHAGGEPEQHQCQSFADIHCSDPADR